MMEHSDDKLRQEMPAPEAAPFSVGRALREGRERLGMSVADVAGRIKFAPRQIEALEADDFGHLFEPAFLRGFVRSYARLLQMDAQPLLQALPGQTQPYFQPASPQTVDAPFPTAKSERRPTLSWLLAALGVAVLTGLYALLSDDGEPDAQEKPATVQTEQPIALNAFLAASAPQAAEAAASEVAAAEAEAPAAAPATVKEPPKPAPASKPEEVRAQAAAPVSAVSAAKPQATEMPKPAPAKVLAAASAPLAASSPAPAKPVEHKEQPAAAAPVVSAVHLVFNEDSTVEVRDHSGKLLTKQHSKKGSQLWLNGEAPFSITLGNARGVRVYYRDKEIPLAPHMRGDAASLTLE